MSTRLIDTPAARDALCAALRDAPWIAFDTEFLRARSYYPRPCLLQVATPDVVACVDPLRLDDLDPVYDLLLDPAHLLVMHSGEQDLEILYHETGRLPRRVFDTQLAGAVLGLGDQVSYAAAVEAMLGPKLGKAHTRTDWSRRPLAPGQLTYAADDVRFLRDLYVVQRDRLAATGRTGWLDEDLAELLSEDRYRVRPETTWRRVKGKGRCTGAALARLQAAAAWREREAMLADTPRRWVLDDGPLLDLVERDPKDAKAIARLGVGGAAGRRLAAALDAARAMPPAMWPVHAHRRALSPEEEQAVERLLEAATTIAEAEGIAPSALATRAQVKRLIAGDDDCALRRGWRAALLNDAVVEVLGGGGG